MLYFQWGEKAAENAVLLAAESKLLFEAGYTSRAYYLAHMSTEESAKSLILKSMCILGMSAKKFTQVSALLLDHRKKIDFLVTYAASLSDALKADIDALQAQSDLTKHINNLKNDAMYVSCKNGNIITPDSRVGAIDVRRYVVLAEDLSFQAMSLQISS